MKIEMATKESLKVRPLPDEISSLDGALFIPIEKLENILDEYNYSTREFRSVIYQDHDGELCVHASIELNLVIEGEIGNDYRTFSGACNFKLSSLQDNQHWNATAKSECIKNAASDAGVRLGRGLNTYLPPEPEHEKVKTAKLTQPDAGIIKQYKKAVADNRIKTIELLEKIYDFTNVTSEPNISNTSKH